MKAYYCPLHTNIRCGNASHYLCDPCKSEGWISQAHIGGPVHYIFNTRTGDRIYDETMLGDKF